ncbi:MAG: phosphate/phosphite/phosphonate ABC transporter substrate-binding protein [Magnetococcales bacterium]|nr:phosphate/phosphite/phosphonate ABC transporter substrate-binding protein [Magnetococcales bacterium]MBF0154315.1 phosphate/phosphite/phosphonate ABC transporter substrate-binding protein [Magnetococcales bacterium]
MRRLRVLPHAVRLVCCLLMLLVHSNGAKAEIPETVLPRSARLVVAQIGNNPLKYHAQLAPLVAYVADRMADLGIRRGEVVVARNLTELSRKLAAGEVDWCNATIHAAFSLEADGLAEPLLLRHKQGVSLYKTVFVSRAEEPLSSLADLRAKRIAFGETDSTSSFHLPSALAVEAGLALFPLQQPEQAVPPAKTGYLFAGTPLNQATWVVRGLADAAAFSNLDWETPQSVPPVLRDRLKMFHVSQPVPRALELVSPALDARLRDRLREILLNAPADPEGRLALEAYQQTSGFATISDEQKELLSKARALLKRTPIPQGQP